MKNVFRSSMIYLYLFTMSPWVYGHLAVEHSFSLKTGLIHMLTDPVHVLMLVVFILIPVLFVFRKHIDLCFAWIERHIFRRW